jgi:hypothetical protein
MDPETKLKIKAKKKGQEMIQKLTKTKSSLAS